MTIADFMKGSSSSRTRRGKVILIVMPLIAAGGAVLLSGPTSAGPFAKSGTEGDKPAIVEVTPEQLEHAVLAEQMLSQIGITPDALAAIGADESKMRTMLATALAFAGGQGSIEGAQADLDHAMSVVHDLEDRIIRGVSSEGDLNSLSAARAQAATADAAKQAVLDQLWAACMASLTEGQRGLMAHIADNAAYEVPPAYKAVARSEADFVKIRDALAAERHADRNGESTPSDAAEAISDAHDNTTTATVALANADNGEMRRLWNGAMGR